MDDTWDQHYTPANRLSWRGRFDGPEAHRLHELTQCIDLRGRPKLQAGSHSYALIGFACDEGVRRNQGRTGASEAPLALRAALANVPIDKGSDFVLYDTGDILCANGNLEEAQKALGAVIQFVLEQGVRPVVLGGGHETAWGHYQGIVAAYPQADIAVVNFDAHLDTRPLVDEKFGSSGTSFYQIAQDRKRRGKDFHYYCLGLQPFANTPHLRDQAEHMGAEIVWAEDFHVHAAKEAEACIERVLEQHQTIYLTIDIDVFAAPFAPGVSATQPLGLLPWHVMPLVHRLAASGKVVGCDVVEVSPPYDHDGRTAQLAASLISTYIHA